MKNVILLLALLLIAANSSAETTLNCQWLESETHPENFYRPAKITMKIQEDKVIFLEDTFLFREYSPCWMGTWSSCAFGYSYQGDTWEIVKQGDDSYYELSAPGIMWDAQLTLVFEKSVVEANRGEVVNATFKGDDNDGVSFENEKFLCQSI